MGAGAPLVRDEEEPSVAEPSKISACVGTGRDPITTRSMLSTAPRRQHRDFLRQLDPEVIEPRANPVLDIYRKLQYKYCDLKL